jgi:aryl-alcohol dehydrogenase-like predicted oxidoreductase
MRLSTDEDRDEARAVATVGAALDAGVKVFDTAHAYARDDTELGHNERLLSAVLRERGATDARIVTKGGMRRPGGQWVPDGRARTLRDHCAASLEALGGLPIDLYLLHAPDPRVAWLTSVRALRRLVDAGLVRHVGLSNVTRRQLDEAVAVAPIAAVQVALGPFSDGPLRGGLVARCIELGIEVLAHSPLGGPSRAPKLRSDEDLLAIASRHGVTAQRVALAAIADIDPSVLPVAGARRPETLRACIVPVTLDDLDRAALDRRFGWRAMLRPPQGPPKVTGSESKDDAEVVLVMGIQGAGKSSTVAAWAARGYERLNRDERGGSMRDLHRRMGERLGSGTRRIVSDNTYTTRAARQGAIEVARRHGARVVGVWLDTPLADAQQNVILRMLEAHGRLLEPDEMERASDPSALGPGALFRMLRNLEAPGIDEGFATLETAPFVRRPRPDRDRGAVFVALDAVGSYSMTGDGPCLVFGWKPGATNDELARMRELLAREVQCCPHPGGPPRCWCRPPLPGLLVEFAERNRVDLTQSTIVGTKPLHAAMARALRASYELVPSAPWSP